MKLNKYLSTTLQILSGIVELAADLPGYKLSRKGFYEIMNGSFPDWPRSKSAMWLNKLEYRNYIKREHDKDGNESIILTNKSRIKILENDIASAGKDDMVRFVSFDIPEVKRAQRDQFRRIIKRVGFVQIQKSLWATRKNVGEIVELAAEECKVTDYVAYIVSNQTNIENFINARIKEKIS